MTTLIIPFGYGLFWAIFIAVVCIGLLWGLRPFLTRILEIFGMSTDKPYLNVLVLIAAVLSPFWLLLFFYTLQATFGVILSSPPVNNDADMLTQYGALAILILILGALTAAPLLLVKSFINERQTGLAEAVHITRERGQVADRFAGAVNQLGAQKTVHKRAPQTLYQTDLDGNFITDDDGQLVPQRTPDGKTIAKWESWIETEPNLEIRLGGLFTLERISQISGREHIAVMETLTAYIRENATSRLEAETTAEMPAQYSVPRADIQIAIKILGRRGDKRIKLEAEQDPPYRLDLRGADLAIVDFSDGKFGPARMERTNLHSAWLDNTSFHGADFSAANMAEAWMEGADLQNARMEETNLNRAWMVGANLSKATMAGADISGAKMHNTDLQEAELDSVITQVTDIKEANLQLAWLRGVDCTGFQNLSQNQIDSAFGDATTTLQKQFTRPLWPRQQISYLDSFVMWNDAKKKKT